MKPVANSLVLYKTHPARILAVGEKIDIELGGGQTKKVRSKDIEILHPGPMLDLKELVPIEGEIEEAWSLLEGTSVHLAELAELIYSSFTPSTAWAAWQWVADGLFFTGTPAAIHARERIAVEQDRKERAEKEAARCDWGEFVTRLRAATMLPTDRERLEEVERVALGQAEHSRIMEAIGHHASKDNAHRLLIAVGYWPPYYNPYPLRCRVSLKQPLLAVPYLPEEMRRDFTHLPAYAIDNEGNQDPDDAISWDGERIWVHIADVAALVTPDNPLDQEARARGANLYLPEGVTPILPHALTHALGLGLHTLSPALSFGISPLIDGKSELEICPSWIRVQRISYQEAEMQLEQEPFCSLHRITSAFRARRQAQGCISIELPEVEIKLINGTVRIQPLEHLHSRELVTDAMLMVGEAVADYCQRFNIPIPYVIQSPPEQLRNPTDLAGMWSYRKHLKPSRLSVEPSPHAGLGLALYTRATSPLRRYSDLLVHQQLRRYIAGQELLSTEQIAERFDIAEMGGITVRRAERQSNNHWKLVWLQQHPNWQGDAIVVEQEQDRLVAIIPELALETKVRV